MTRLSPNLSRLYIGVLALLSFLLYLLLLRWFPLRPYFNVSPSPDIRSLAPSIGEAAAYGGLLCLLYGLYWLAYCAVRDRKEGLTLTAIFLTAVAFCIPLLFAFPVNATDVYRYFIRGRIASVYHQDPFTVPVSEIGDELYLPLAGEWATETSPYGPLWELGAASVTSLVPDNLWVNLLAFKLLASLIFLICGALIWLSLSGLPAARRSSLTLLWAWNPALLLIFAMNGHNDGLMILWLLLGFWLIRRGQLQVGLIIMMLAPLTKPVGLLPLPFFFVAGWRQLPNRSAQIRYLLTSSFAAIVLILLAFLPFGSPLDLALRLLREAGSGGGFSIAAWYILELRELGFNPNIPTTARLGSLFILLVGLALVWVTSRGRSCLRAAADIFAAYIVQAFRFRIWYAAWPFPWLILDSGRSPEDTTTTKSRLAGGLAFLLLSQLSVLIYGQIRVEWLGASQLRAHRLGVFITFVVPLLFGLAVAAYNARLHGPQREKSSSTNKPK